MEYPGGINLTQKLCGRVLILGNDRIRVMRSEVIDMRNRLVATLDYAQRDRERSIFGMPFVVVDEIHTIAVNRACLLAPADFHASELKQLDKLGNEAACDPAVCENSFDCITRRRRLNFAVEDHRSGQIEVSSSIDVDMTHTVRMSKYWNPRVA